jgi:hypothetical protein
VSLLDELPDDMPGPGEPQARCHPWRASLGIITLANLFDGLMSQRQITEFARGPALIQHTRGLAQTPKFGLDSESN